MRKVLIFLLRNAKNYDYIGWIVKNIEIISFATLKKYISFLGERGRYCEGGGTCEGCIEVIRCEI